MPGPGDTEIANELAKNVPSFDIDAARRAGATDSAIVDELAPKVPNFDVAGARAHFAQQAAPPAAPPSAPVGNPAIGSAPIAYGDQAVNALAFGQAPRVAAAVQSLLGNGKYSDLEQQYRSSLAEDKRDHPIASLAGTATGAILNPLNKALAGLGLVKGAAVAGALQGSGDAKDDLSSQLTGAGLGAATGAATGGVLRGVSRLLGPNAGTRVVANAASKSDVLAELAKLKDAGRGDVAVLADLSPRLNGVLDRAASRNPDVMDAAQQIVNGRQPDAAGRLTDDLTAGAGNPHLGTMLEQMKQQRLGFAAGRAGFQGLRDANPTLPANADLTDVLNKPGMQDAWNLARKADNLDGTPVGTYLNSMLGQKVNPAQSLGLTQMAPAGASAPVSYQSAAELERILDGKAGTAYAQGNVPLGQAYKTLRNGVGDFLETTTPAHARVKAVYSAMKANEEAAQAGADAWKNPSARDVAAKVAALTPARLDYFRKGLASAAIDELGNRATNLDPASRFVNASASTQQKLQTIFGDEPTFQKFMDAAKAEQTLGKLRSVTGGSATARRGADEAMDGAGMAMRGATSLAHGRGFISSLVHTFAPTLERGMRGQTAADAGKLLTTQGAGNIEALLARLAKQNQLQNYLAQGGVGAANGVASSLLGQ